MKFIPLSEILQYYKIDCHVGGQETNLIEWLKYWRKFKEKYNIIYPKRSKNATTSTTAN